MTAGKTATAHVLARSRWVVTAAAAGLVLGACANGGDSSDEPSTSASSASSSATATAEAPPGVEVTAPGSQLSFGDDAVVDHEVRGETTLLELTVKAAERGSLKDFAGFNLSDPYQRKANYYYVQVTAENVGEGKLGGIDVPLWGISGDNTLLPPVKFTSSFKKCPTEPLPKRFGPGKKHASCLVFLSPDKGTLEGVSYRPVESFDPIEWRGQVTTPADKASKGKKNSKKQGGNGGGGNNG